MIGLTRGEALKNGVSVKTNFAKGLPIITGDRVQLEQVVLNLILNALQAMSAVSEERSTGANHDQTDRIDRSVHWGSGYRPRLEPGDPFASLSTILPSKEIWRNPQ